MDRVPTVELDPETVIRAVVEQLRSENNLVPLFLQRWDHPEGHINTLTGQVLRRYRDLLAGGTPTRNTTDKALQLSSAGFIGLIDEAVKKQRDQLRAENEELRRRLGDT